MDAHKALGVRVHANLDLAAGRREFECIADEVREHLDDATAVDHDVGSVFRHAPLESNVLSPSPFDELLTRLLDERPHGLGRISIARAFPPLMRDTSRRSWISRSMRSFALTMICRCRRCCDSSPWTSVGAACSYRWCEAGFGGRETRSRAPRLA